MFKELSMAAENKKNNINSGVRAKTNFNVLNSVVFDSKGRNQKRAQIMTVNGDYFVSLSGFWKPSDCDDYIPNGKCIFLNFQQWKNLLKEVVVIDTFIADAIKDGINLTLHKT